jgi:hypothetical protein
MPAVSDRQQRFMGAELARKRAGKQTQTGMSEAQLEDFAKKKAPAAGRVKKKPPKPKPPPPGY